MVGLGGWEGRKNSENVGGGEEENHCYHATKKQNKIRLVKGFVYCLWLLFFVEW